MDQTFETETPPPGFTLDGENSTPQETGGITERMAVGDEDGPGLDTQGESGAADDGDDEADDPSIADA